MTALCNLLLLVALQATPADPTIHDLVAAFEQNRNSFIAIEVDYTCITTASDAFARGIEFEIEHFIKQLERRNLPDELVAQIKSESAPGVKFEVAKRQFIQRTVDQRRLSLSHPTEADRYILQITPALADVRIFLNNSLKNPRRKYALDHDMPSFTGGDFKHLQRKPGEKWIGLDPYPMAKKTGAIAWTQSTLALDSMLPPFVNSEELSLDSSTPSALEAFWMQPDSLLLLGQWSPGSGEQLQLVMKPIDDARFSLSAIDASKGSMPRWITQCSCINGASARAVTYELAATVASQVEFFRKAPLTDKRENAVPEDIVYFDLYEAIDGAGWYPLLIKWTPLALLYTADSLQKQLDWREIPFGVRDTTVLTVHSLKANADVQESAPLVLPDGARFLDQDTNTVSLIGESPDEAINRLLPEEGLPRRRITLFVINGVAIGAILIVLYFRRRFRQNGGPR